MDSFVKSLGFPKSVEVPVVIPYSDFIKDVRCRTSNMLENQMKTFGLTIDRVKRIDLEGGRELFIDSKMNKLILEVGIIPEEFKALITYKYEDYEGEI
jgi:hypothetical protein